ncbi:hypothetical protein DL98DRAFT_586909 [Cadophora sp. DSE1049]|nr:hypothetical protein DL98DRAFT_586909 [Cadophora sp. DSE1049]
MATTLPNFESSAPRIRICPYPSPNSRNHRLSPTTTASSNFSAPITLYDDGVVKNHSLPQQADSVVLMTPARHAPSEPQCLGAGPSSTCRQLGGEAGRETAGVLAAVRLLLTSGSPLLTALEIYSSDDTSIQLFIHTLDAIKSGPRIQMTPETISSLAHHLQAVEDLLQEMTIHLNNSTRGWWRRSVFCVKRTCGRTQARVIRIERQMGMFVRENKEATKRHQSLPTITWPEHPLYSGN